MHLIYRSKHYEGHSKDYEFSRLTMQEHWRAGCHDATRTLRHPEVLERLGMAERAHGIVVAGAPMLLHGQPGKLVILRVAFVVPSSFFGETQMVDFARVSRRSRVRYWVRSGLIPSRAKALVWSGVGRA